MLPRAHRISRAHFPRSSRVRTHGAFVTIGMTPAPSFTAAVIVSKKVAKSAVARNRLRRRAYEIFDSLRKNYPTAAGQFVAVLAPATAGVPFRAFREDMERAFRHLLEKRTQPR